MTRGYEHSDDPLGQGSTDWHAYQAARARFLTRLAQQSAQVCARRALEELGRELAPTRADDAQTSDLVVSTDAAAPGLRDRPSVPPQGRVSHGSSAPGGPPFGDCDGGRE